MAHSVSLALVLFALWLFLSGVFEPLLIVLGAVSAVIVVVLAHRMDVIDREGHPVHLTWRALLFWPWLASEIVKANMDVSRRVLDPRLPITPTLVRVKASQKTDLGQVIYANSITLTPGTVSVDLQDDYILVHALTREGAQTLAEGEMDRRVGSVEGHE